MIARCTCVTLTAEGQSCTLGLSLRFYLILYIFNSCVRIWSIAELGLEQLKCSHVLAVMSSVVFDSQPHHVKLNFPFIHIESAGCLFGAH